VQSGSVEFFICTKMNYDNFMHNANRAYLDLDVEDQQRYGQFLMNYLQEHHPDIVVPEEADCFYNNNKVPNFFQFIHSLDSNV
jgi:hypothetical protein